MVVQVNHLILRLFLQQENKLMNVDNKNNNQLQVDSKDKEEVQRQKEKKEILHLEIKLITLDKEMLVKMLITGHVGIKNQRVQ